MCDAIWTLQALWMIHESWVNWFKNRLMTLFANQSEMRIVMLFTEDHHVLLINAIVVALDS